MTNIASKDYIRSISWDAARALGRSFEALRRGSNDTLLTYLEPSYESRSIQVPFKESLSGRLESEKVRCFTIVFPYLVLVRTEQHAKRRARHKTLQRDLEESKSVLCFDHLEPTLDEAYYPGLSRQALDEPNDDQIISHSKDDFASYDKREKSSGKSGENAFILMVPQLWLYRLGSVVISACSTPQGTVIDNEKNEFFESLIRRKTNASAHKQDANIHLGLVITSFIDRFGKSYTHQGAHYPPPLDLFEMRVLELLSEVRSYMKMPPGGRSDLSGLEYRRERYFLHVISDIRSELAMVQHVLDQQERIFKQFLEDRSAESVAEYAKEWAPIENCQETIQQYMRRVKKIDDDAERIEKSIQDMLNLKRTHASIRDAHSSLIVSTAVLGFTVITVVFTPLAFLTALFALKVDGFEKLQVSGSDGVYHSGKIGGVFGKLILLIRMGVPHQHA